MKRPEEMILDELREEMREILVEPNPEELDFEDLVAIKKGIDADEAKRSYVWTVPTTKKELLTDIETAIAQYKEFDEVLKKQGNRSFSFRCFIGQIYHALKRLKNDIERIELSDLTEEFCGYTYEITKTSIILRLTRFEWTESDEEIECSRGQETEILSVKLPDGAISEYGYDMEGVYPIYD